MVIAAQSGLNQLALVRLLADGRLHSGETLAERLGVSRAAVWKAIERLRVRGIAVTAVPRRGYAFPAAVKLLDGTRIRGAVAAEQLERIRRLELHFEVDSTNSRLLALPPPPPGTADILLSELQHAGRGRRGRPWIAPFGGSIALSVAWTFADASRASPTLSLCVGVAIVRALVRAGARNILLKWPNDVWFSDRKIGGVLTESRSEAGGPAHVVIGVGINVTLDEAVRARFAAARVRVAAVADACKTPPCRSFLAGAIIDELLSMLGHFEREGFEWCQAPWAALDALRDRAATVLIGAQAVSGIARGVNGQGALRLECDGRVQEFSSGEVSLRVAEDMG